MDSRIQNKYGQENNSSVVELSEKDFDGIKLNHPDFKNKYTLLKIYAPWCGYCVRMTNEMNHLGRELPKRNIGVAAINYEQNKELVSKIGSKGFPSMFIVDKSGKLHETLMGGRTLKEMLVSIKFKTKELDN